MDGFKRGRDTNVVEVSTEGCKNVDDFIKAVKKELEIQRPPQEISISLSAGGDALDPGDAVPNQNTSRAPLYISVYNAHVHLQVFQN